MKQDCISINEAAKLLNVIPQTVRLWAKEGKIPSTVTLGGHHRILREDILKLIKTKK